MTPYVSIRMECPMCGYYNYDVAYEPSPLPEKCHHCNSPALAGPVCKGQTLRTLPFISQPWQIEWNKQVESMETTKKIRMSETRY